MTHPLIISFFSSYGLFIKDSTANHNLYILNGKIYCALVLHRCLICITASNALDMLCQYAANIVSLKG